MNVIEKGSKLFVKGLPTPFGYAFCGNVDYNVKEGKIPPLRLKEWDFYQITSEKFSAYFIIGHVSYATSINCTLFEFESGRRTEVSTLVFGKAASLDKNAEEDSFVEYKSKDLSLSFETKGNKRKITLLANSKNYGECVASLALDRLFDESILVCTPFSNKKHFYLNHKIALTADGFARFGDREFLFKKNECFGGLDWGRGYLPFSHEWLWGAGYGITDGEYFGFNIGKFGNNENGTENVFFIGNKAYKLGNMAFEFDKNDYMKPWHCFSDDGLFDLTMTPTFDNHTFTKLLFVDNSCHQVFGKWNGFVVADGQKKEIKNFFASCERAKNQW